MGPGVHQFDRSRSVTGRAAGGATGMGPGVHQFDRVRASGQQDFHSRESPLAPEFELGRWINIRPVTQLVKSGMMRAERQKVNSSHTA